MTSKDPTKAAEIEAKLRAAVEAGGDEPTYKPLIGDIMNLFGAGRSTIQGWFKNGVRIGGREFTLRYWLSAGNYREVHPADVLAILDETRKLRSSHDPDGVGDVCLCCGQPLPKDSGPS